MSAVLKARAPPEFTYKEAWAYVGGLSRPSKMPGWAYGLPAKECKVGSKLRGVDGSVCSKCYALKGRYSFANVQTVQYKRLASITEPYWVEAMTTLILSTDCTHFRWHDSGDIQSPSHLQRIVEVAENCSRIKFWIPTREKVFVYSHLKRFRTFPKNLVVRVSGAMIDGAPPTGFPNTSTVSSTGGTCPAPSQGGHCGLCRACWNPRVANVSYHKH